MSGGEGTIASARSIDERIASLLEAMSVDEKIGQLQQVQGAGGHVPLALADAIRAGRVGSIINEVDAPTVRQLQQLAVRESPHGIPLLIGRDVIHGFNTVFPIPLGMASSWSPDAVRRASQVAAHEAAATGVNWTFAPMLDIGRDPRWGRVAEGFGEDPHLTSVLGAAAVQGFQGTSLSESGSIAACAKHFVGYGASESGRDYNSTNIAPRELSDVHLPPFEAAVQAGVATVMTSFSDIDGVPATANRELLQGVLRDQWHFTGLVVSDWDSVRQLAVHGITADDRASAAEAARAGVDMEMVSTTYGDHLASLLSQGVIKAAQLDTMVANVLRLKLQLGLFDLDFALEPSLRTSSEDAARVALDVARESIVLLVNRERHGEHMLPLSPAQLSRVAVIGPLADDPHEQLGTWIFDGDATRSVTVLDALRTALPPTTEITHARGVENTRTLDTSSFAAAIEAVTGADVAIMVLGEEAILSGEAHCRAEIALPGAQEALIAAVAATGVPVVLVVMAGRALALERVVPHVQGLFLAFHPGSQGGPAIVDLLLGQHAPSARLPVTLPRVTGQIPIYYAHKQTGKPATPDTIISIHDIESRAPQLSIGNTSFHLDVAPDPLFSFGYGLTYTWVDYESPTIGSVEVPIDGTVEVSAVVTNRGRHAAVETVQLYVRDLVGSVTRPVKELKGFQRITLEPGERRIVHFVLPVSSLAFCGRDLRRRVEPGHFHAWIAAHAAAGSPVAFTVLP